MFLKRLTLTGFKSFADKTDFDFTSGITCIVGPNGCGKSNVVDSIKWVLGEQSARSLRGRQMMDMIFNGSRTRPSSSVSQVDLLFDNADGKLPIDSAEITVTRKLYRSGDSEYLINNEVARLKDIRDLFLDTGVGAHSYSVIEQGQVDRLLQSSPVERRQIFDEAAGISRFKARKKEALRKLERTEQNLLRVADIIDEVDRRLRQVKTQATKARHYQEYMGRLNDLRSAYALAEYHRFTVTLDELHHATQELTAQAEGLRTRITQDEAQQLELTTRLDRLGEQISETDGGIIRTQGEVATQEQRIEQARRRIEESAAVRDRARHRDDTARERQASCRQELDAQHRAADELQRHSHELHAQVAELEEQDRALAREITQTQAVLEDEKSGIIDLLRRSAQTNNEIIRLNTHCESLTGQKGRLHQRGEQLSAELHTLMEERGNLELRIHDLDSLITAERGKLEQKKLDAVRVEELRRQIVDELTRTKEHRSAVESRRDVLRELERQMEGVGAGAAHLLKARQEGRHDRMLDAVWGLVADVFEADLEHAPVIEAALGEAVGSLVVLDSGQFLSRPDKLADLPGSLTVICMDRLPPLVNEREYETRPGYVCRAVDLVRYDDRFHHLALHLLSRTIVVESLSDALTLAAEDVRGHRFVTRRGEVVESDGRIRFGVQGARAGLLSRKSELRGIDEQLASADETIRKLADQLNRTEAELAHLQTVQQELTSAIHECHTAKAEASTSLQSISEAVRRLSHEQPIIAQEVSLLEQQIAEMLHKSAETGRSLEALEAENRERETRVAQQQTRLDEQVAVRRNVQERLTELRVQAGQLSVQRAAAADTIKTLRATIQDLEKTLAAAEADIQQCEARIREGEGDVERGQQELARLAGLLAELTAEAARLRDDRERLRVELESIGQDVKTTRESLTQHEAALHEREMSIRETAVRRDDLTARIAEELGIQLGERYTDYAHTEQDWTAVETEIAELRGKIERLGNVNLDAITELEELEQRSAFLTRQRDDLQEAEAQLRRLIGQLDAEASERFRTMFEEIREHFRGLFRKLFGGGRADVVLENPEDLLESGIEILAQPPGKDLQSISLMSGGEKSMTAIALVMSMFKARPAPFAVLDEVDAALDEANNERYNRIVQEFAETTQFLIITHSKRTMSIADHLYGVTMQEPGVSTRVGVELAKADVA